MKVKVNWKELGKQLWAAALKTPFPKININSC